LNAYEDALYSLSSEPERSYSIFIFIIETLTQNFDDYIVEWTDVLPEIRTQLDEVLHEINEDLSSKIKEILCSGKHVRLMKRIQAYVTKNIDDSFFDSSNTLSRVPLKKSIIPQAIVNSYNVRSRYSHELKKIDKTRSTSNSRDAEYIELKSGYILSLSGLYRLVRHLLLKFINLEYEKVLSYPDFSWDNSELPGVLQSKIPTDYWINNINELTQKSSKVWFEALLDIFEYRILLKSYNDKKSDNFFGFDTQNGLGIFKYIPDFKYDLKGISEKAFSLIKNANKEDKTKLFNILRLLNHFDSDYRVSLDEYFDISEECSVENIVVSIIIKDDDSWNPESCEDELNKYLKNRKIKIPTLVKIMMFIFLGNKFNQIGQTIKSMYWLSLARDDSGSYPKLQEYLRKSIKNNISISPNIVFSTYLLISDISMSEINKQYSSYYIFK
jgi:hypothetical protein